MKTVGINGETYRLGKMPARTQFHVLRRIMPVMASLAPVAIALGLAKPEGGAGDEPMEVDKFFGMIGPMAEGLARMADADMDFVINNVMAQTAKNVNGQWAPMLAPDGFTFMFQDMGMELMLQLTLAGIRENFGNFFDLLRLAGLAPQAGVEPAATEASAG